MSELAKELLVVPSEDALYATFARHVLVNCQGVLVIEHIRNLMASDSQLSKANLADELRRHGFHVPWAGKHLHVLRLWLQKFGVLNPTGAKKGSSMWTPNDDRVKQLLGVSSDDIDKFGELTRYQRDFARAFAALDVDEEKASRVRDYAKALYGTVFPEVDLPKSVLHKLQEVGLITWVKATEGRGAKSHIVRPTETLRHEMLVPLLEKTESVLGKSYRHLIRMKMPNIMRDLGSSDTHAKGVALEALTFYLTRLLDLTFVSWRLRSQETGGSEVDIIVEGARLTFSRWQIQCKNTQTVKVEHVAKEVGIATAMRTNVVMVVSTGRIAASTVAFAKAVMQNTAMQIIFLDGDHLERIRQSPSEITTILNEQAFRAMEIKRSQVGNG